MRNSQIPNTPSVQIVRYAYENNPITFQVNGKVMVSATQMAKSFKHHKRPLFWLKLQSTQDFLQELSKVRFLTLADLVQVRQGGANPGTWMHEDVALEFARWLSPAFAIWCNDRIKELLLTGKTTLQRTPDNNLQTELKEAKAEIKRMSKQLSTYRSENRRLVKLHYQILGKEKQEELYYGFRDNTFISVANQFVSDIKQLGSMRDRLQRIAKDDNLGACYEQDLWDANAALTGIINLMGDVIGSCITEEVLSGKELHL